MIYAGWTRGGVPRAEIARRLHLSRNTVAHYADMNDMSPEPPIPAHRVRPAIDPHIDWIDSLLEADLSAPRKQTQDNFAAGCDAAAQAVPVIIGKGVQQAQRQFG